MSFVVLQIRHGPKILKPWFGSVVAECSTVADIFSTFSAGKLDSSPPLAEEFHSCQVDAAVGKTKCDFVNVSPLTPVRDVVGLLGPYIEFSVKRTDSEDQQQASTSRAPDAFQLMMASASSSMHDDCVVWVIQ